MILTLFWTVFFCLGLYLITSEGQILYFIREPFENNYSTYEVIKERLEHFKKFDKSLVSQLKWTILKHKLIAFIGKPLIHCITCMASIWGITVFVVLHGLHLHLLPQMILNSVCASFIQTFIWNLYAKHIQ